MVGKQQFPDKHSVWINTRLRALALSLDYTQYCSLTHWDAPTHGWGSVIEFCTRERVFFSLLHSVSAHNIISTTIAPAVLRCALRRPKDRYSNFWASCLVWWWGGFSSRRSCGVQFCASSLTFCVSFSTCVYSVTRMFTCFSLFLGCSQRLRWTDCRKKLVRKSILFFFSFNLNSSHKVW